MKSSTTVTGVPRLSGARIARIRVGRCSSYTSAPATVNRASGASWPRTTLISVATFRNPGRPSLRAIPGPRTIARRSPSTAMTSPGTEKSVVSSTGAAGTATVHASMKRPAVSRYEMRLRPESMAAIVSPAVHCSSPSATNSSGPRPRPPARQRRWPVASNARISRVPELAMKSAPPSPARILRT
jgi:hypothetical protein